MKAWISWFWDLTYLVIACSLVLISASVYARQAQDNEKFCQYRAEFSRSVALIRDLRAQGYKYVQIGGENYIVVENAKDYKDSVAKHADEWQLNDRQVSSLGDMIDYIWLHQEMPGDQLFEMYYQYCANPMHAM